MFCLVSLVEEELKFNPTNQHGRRGQRGPTGETGATNGYGRNDGRRLMDNGDMVNQLFPYKKRV